MKAFIKLISLFAAAGLVFSTALPVSADKIIRGDIDSDGVLTSADALTILRSSVGLIKLTPYQFRTADYNRDNFVDSSDALAVLIRSINGGTPEPDRDIDEHKGTDAGDRTEDGENLQTETKDEAKSTDDTPAQIDERCIRILELCNEERAKEGIAPLVYDSSMTKAALVRVNEIPVCFDHIRPNGKAWFTALDEKGVKAAHSGENIAAGYASPELIVEEWMRSEKHRKNIMDPGFKRMCAAITLIPGDRYGLYWEQLFAS